MKILRSCSLCGSSRASFLYKCSDVRYPVPGEFAVFRCSDCGVLFVNPQPGEKELRKHFPRGRPTLRQARNRRHVAVQGFEYEQEPVKALRQLRSSLKPGDTVSIQLSSTDSLLHRVFRKHWAGLDVPRKQHIHGRKSIAVLAQKAGFEIVNVHDLLDARSLQESASLALHVIMKRHGFLSQQSWSAVLRLFALPVVMVLAMLRQGDRIEVTLRQS